MAGLFDNDPINRYIRDSNGRFCTAEYREYERAKNENKILRLQVEKYKRMADVAVKDNIKKSRILAELRETIKNLQNKLA